LAKFKLQKFKNSSDFWSFPIARTEGKGGGWRKGKKKIATFLHLVFKV